MLDIGFMEILVLGAIALIVVGPKDLPGLLRTVGQFVGKARAMARDFQRTMEDAARDADLGDVADVVKNKGNLSKMPFDNQVVDTLKEFERTVKSETTDAIRAAEGAATPSASTKPSTPAKPSAAPAATPSVEASASPTAPPSPASSPPPAAAPAPAAASASTTPQTTAATTPATAPDPSKAEPAAKSA